jgi:hypothetical protein
MASVRRRRLRDNTNAEIRRLVGKRVVVGDVSVPLTVMVLSQLLIFQGSSHMACDIPVAGFFDAVCWIVQAVLVMIIMTLLTIPRSPGEDEQYTSIHNIIWAASMQQWCMALASSGCPVMAYVSFGLFGFGILSSILIFCFDRYSDARQVRTNASTPLLSVHLDSPILTTVSAPVNVPAPPKSFNISESPNSSNESNAVEFNAVESNAVLIVTQL